MLFIEYDGVIEGSTYVSLTARKRIFRIFILNTNISRNNMERNYLELWKQFVNEQTGIEPTPIADKKSSRIYPKDYVHVSQMIDNALRQGKTVTIELKQPDSIIRGLAEVDGLIRTIDVAKIMP